MEIRTITNKEREEFNRVAGHPLQSFEWGEFREKTGVKVVRRGFFDPSADGGKLVKGFSLTLHKIPKTPFKIGYLPKGEMPDAALISELKKIGEEERCIFIQLEPNVIAETSSEIPHFVRDDKLRGLKLCPAAHPLFTKYTFVLDLTKSEEELLKAMHPKARYNIKVALKHGVEVVEDNTDAAFEEYLRLMRETTERQKFYAHTEKYHREMWDFLGKSKVNPFGKLRTRSQKSKADDGLSAHLMVAKYQGKVLTAWILFVFKDTLYYPYGASSSENREVMASNLMMWEVIRFGKKLGLKKFDMWGALGPNPDKNDPWYGFHSFKEKYGPAHTEFVGSYDLVVSPWLYELYKAADKLRWLYLRVKK